MDSHMDSSVCTFQATYLLTYCKKRLGKKEPPLWTIGEGLYWAVALGQNSRGRVSKEVRGGLRSKGSLRGKKEPAESVRAGKGFIAQAGPPI